MALAAAKEESKRLQAKLKKNADVSDSTIADLQRQHSSAIKILQAKVVSYDH